MGNYADLLNAQTHQHPPSPAQPMPKDAPRSVPRAPASQTVPSPTPVPQRVTDQDPTPRTAVRPYERTTDRTHGPPNARTAVRRRAKRYAFEFYEDQIERVKRLALEDQLRGGTLNQSEIVRRAIDRYLAELGKEGE